MSVSSLAENRRKQGGDAAVRRFQTSLLHSFRDPVGRFRVFLDRELVKDEVHGDSGEATAQRSGPSDPVASPDVLDGDANRGVAGTVANAGADGAGKGSGRVDHASRGTEGKHERDKVTETDAHGRRERTLLVRLVRGLDDGDDEQPGGDAFGEESATGARTPHATTSQTEKTVRIFAAAHPNGNEADAEQASRDLSDDVTQALLQRDATGEREGDAHRRVHLNDGFLTEGVGDQPDDDGVEKGSRERAPGDHLHGHAQRDVRHGGDEFEHRPASVHLTGRRSLNGELLFSHGDC